MKEDTSTTPYKHDANPCQHAPMHVGRGKGWIRREKNVVKGMVGGCEDSDAQNPKLN